MQGGLNFYNYQIVYTRSLSCYTTTTSTTVLRPLIQDNSVEQVLSQRRDLLEQPMDFYGVLPAAQPTVSKYYRKT